MANPANPVEIRKKMRCEKVVESRAKSWKVVESRANSLKSGKTREISAWKGAHGARLLVGIYQGKDERAW